MSMNGMGQNFMTVVCGEHGERQVHTIYHYGFMVFKLFVNERRVALNLRIKDSCPAQSGPKSPHPSIDWSHHFTSNNSARTRTVEEVTGFKLSPHLCVTLQQLLF